MVELGLMVYLGNRAYGDPIRAVRFGRDVASGAISIRTHVDNTKTFLGPVAWYQIWRWTGLAGLHALKLGLLAGIALTQLRLTKERSRTVALLALFFLLLYPGTHRNVVPGEADDLLATLLLAIGVLVFRKTDRPVFAGLVLGVALLFKFWIVIFVGGFLAFLVAERRWRETLLAGAAALVPFLAIDLAFAGAASNAFLYTTSVLAHRSWSLVATRMLTTGLLPCFLVAGWALLRNPSETRRLFFLIPALYPLYVIVTQDAHAVSFVMTACLVTWSPLIAEVVRELVPRRVLAPLLVAYGLAGIAIAVQHLHRDTLEFELGDEVTAPAMIDASPRGIE